MHVEEKKCKKKIMVIPEGDVFLSCEILGSCCDVVVLGSTLFLDVMQQPRLRNVPEEPRHLAIF
jgi:hypothetical protein